MEEGSRSSPLSGPLAPLADGFEAYLAGLGYVSTGLSGQRALFTHLDRWLGARGLTLADLAPMVFEQFLEARAAEGYVTKLTNHALEPLLEHLGLLGVYARPMPPVTGLQPIVTRFHRYLVQERGLGADTAANYERVAQRFLASRRLAIEADVAQLRAGDVTAFVLAQSQQLGVAAMQTVVGGMRALLQFLHTAGLIDRSLGSAVPSVARRREDLPRALSPEHVDTLLQGCDRTTPVGLRDLAVLTVLARLGLRANEVASLRLDDIDWAAGEVRVRGKGPRVDMLPLPADVGEALVDYLKHGRPQCGDPHVFIRWCAPRRGLSRQAIGGLVRAASLRAGLAPHGPHRLRHTVATGLLRQGAPLVEIGQLLRHQSLQSTVLYAKVDTQALSALAQPWPSGGSQ